MRALGFDPANEEIVQLIKELGRSATRLDNEMIDFQEFLEIMIVKMSQKDTPDDIEKAFGHFEDENNKGIIIYNKGKITKRSLRKVAKELEENLTEAEIEELLQGAIDKEKMLNLGRIDSEETKISGKGGEKDINAEIVVTLEEFKALLSSDINDDKIRIPKLKK